MMVLRTCRSRESRTDKIDGNKLTLAGNEPGDSTYPTSFSATSARVFELTKQ
jgi:hypothetical protein